MPIADDQLSELKHAYQVLGVPLSASALSTKQTYRKLMKRWHPDLYANGTSDHAEATRMTKSINEAYSAIARAPLRYYVETNSLADRTSKQAARASTNESSSIRAETLPDTDRLEFWVRFVCGALFGVVASFRLSLDFFDRPAMLGVSAAAAILGFGFASARYGDRFWHSILRHWWFWS